MALLDIYQVEIGIPQLASDGGGGHFLGLPLPVGVLPQKQSPQTQGHMLILLLVDVLAFGTQIIYASIIVALSHIGYKKLDNCMGFRDGFCLALQKQISVPDDCISCQKENMNTWSQERYEIAPTQRCKYMEITDLKIHNRPCRGNIIICHNPRCPDFKLDGIRASCNCSEYKCKFFTAIDKQ